MNKQLCIYHGNCADGFGAAFVIWDLGWNTADFLAGSYGCTPPDVAGRDVVIVDFSYKRSVLLDMAEKANSILILDHHRSAERELIDLPDNVDARFDMGRSGAIMAWDHYHPGEDPPALLLHIQDRDLFRFELEGTKEIMACVLSFPYDFHIWELLLATDVEMLRHEGEPILRKHNKDVRELISCCGYRMKIAGIDVPVLNAPYFWASDAGHIMGEGEPFAACYWDKPAPAYSNAPGANVRQFSLRSASDGMDVSEIAARYGGGGHEHAAGFWLPFDELCRLDNE